MQSKCERSPTYLPGLEVAPFCQPFNVRSRSPSALTLSLEGSNGSGAKFSGENEVRTSSEKVHQIGS